MDHKNKFAAETVLQLQQSLDKVPPHQATELSKQQTIRTLSPQIFALRSKGTAGRRSPRCSRNMACRSRWRPCERICGAFAKKPQT